MKSRILFFTLILIGLVSISFNSITNLQAAVLTDPLADLGANFPEYIGESYALWPTSHLTKLRASDPATWDWFGFSLSTSYDIAVVGAWADDASAGSAYIYKRNQGGTNSWGQIKKIMASDAGPSDVFGKSVAISGDTIVVGSSGDDDLGGSSGSAYIFQQNYGGPDNWGEVVKILASDGANGEVFGGAVGISEDTVVVGAKNDDANRGAAYIFERHQGGINHWGEVTKLTGVDRTSGYYFGVDVAISGDTVVVGKYQDNTLGNGSGSAYIFERNQGGPNQWGQVAKLTAHDADANDQFGYSVAIEGDTVIIGAWADNNGATDTGSAYVFNRNQSGPNQWGQVAKLVANDAAANDFFGVDVAIKGDTIVVGAYKDDDKGSESGSIYIFDRYQGGPNQWGQAAKVTASDGATEDWYGESVIMNEEFIFVGVRQDDDVLPDSGSVYVYQVEPITLTLAIDNVSIIEGDTGTDEAVFNVSLSAAASQPLTITYTTKDGTATVANNDYLAASGVITFPPGVTFKTIPVTINGDTQVETTEVFYVDLLGISSPTSDNPDPRARAVIVDGQAWGTITNDDLISQPPPDADLVVNSLADNRANDGVCTLREAIIAANTDTASGVVAGECAVGSGADTIGFYLPAPATIILSADLPKISSDINFVGPGSPHLTISGDDKFRVFFVDNGQVSFLNLTVAHGLAAGGRGGSGAEGGGGGGGAAGMGGGLFINAGTVMVQHSRFLNNQATGGQGGSGGFTAVLDAGGGTWVGGGGGGGGGGVSGPGADVEDTPYDGGSGGSGDPFNYPDGLGGDGQENSSQGFTGQFGGGGGGGGGGDSTSFGTYLLGFGGSGGFGGGGGGAGALCFRISSTQIAALSGRASAGGAFGGSSSGSGEVPGDNNPSRCQARGGGGGGGAGLGGAIFIRSGVLSLTQVIFLENSANGAAGGQGPDEATQGQAGAGKGGAIFVNSGATTSIENVFFNENHASQASASQDDNDHIYGMSMDLNSGYLITADDGVFSDPVVIEYEPQTPINTEAQQHVGLFYDLDATYLANGLPAQPEPGKRYSITVNYRQEDVPADVDERILALYSWNGSTWIKEPTSTVDVDANTITATPTHFSLWAALIDGNSSLFWPVYLPIIIR